ncbi:MAG: 50S ribosomal protein L18e [Candidatus Micrarchaeaceae archaeon]
MKINVEKRDVIEWLDVLSEASRGKHYPALWKRVRGLVAVPSRRRASVNLYKLNKHTKAGDNVVVPGKVLSVGAMDHKINVAAIEFSMPARSALKAADCKMMTIKEMVKADKVHLII